jgi:hypothetical protein
LKKTDPFTVTEPAAESVADSEIAAGPLTDSETDRLAGSELAADRLTDSEIPMDLPIGAGSDPPDGSETVTDILIVSQIIGNLLTDSDTDHPYVGSGTVAGLHAAQRTAVNPLPISETAVDSYTGSEAVMDPLTESNSDLCANSEAAMDLFTDTVSAVKPNRESGAGRLTDVDIAANPLIDSRINITPLKYCTVDKLNLQC